MDDWSIARRISAITMCLMAALALVAAMGLFSTIRTGALFAEYRLGSGQSSFASGISGNLFEAQLGETRFRSGGAEEQAAEVLSNLDAVLAIESEFVALFEADGTLRDAAIAIQRETAEYRSTFLRTLDFQEVQKEHVRNLVGLGPDTRTMMNNLSTELEFDGYQSAINAVSGALQKFLLARIYVERFLQTNAADDFEIAEGHFRDALAQLETARSSTPSATRSGDFITIIEAVNAYRTEALAAREAIEARNAERIEMDRLAASLSDNIETVVDTVTKHQLDLGISSERTKLMTLVVLIAFFAAALIASFLFARKVARRTSAAIAVSVDQMGELAEGNLEIEITGTEQEHELGEMARALKVFRENARAAREMERRQQQLAAETQRKEAEAAKREAENEIERNRKIEEARRAMIAELRSSVGAVVEAGAMGDFSRRIDAVFEETELNQLANSINELVASVEGGIAETARVMARIATGDLTDRMHGDFRGTFAELKSNVNETINTLGNLVTRISGQCDALGGASARMTDQANELARRAEQQAASLEETSAAMEEISASARSSAEGASNAAEFARDASVRVDDAGQVVAAAVSAMSDIRDASNRINEIVAVIDGIAFQTNLLALNASVEAARAGSAGKGFAVVATEVRALAQRSSEASKDIKGLIDESANQVRKGVELVEQTGTTLEEIMAGVNQMASTMQELTTTAREQATGVAEVTSAITQLDAITQKNAALSENSRDTASEVRGESEAMRDLVLTFRTASSDASGHADNDRSMIAAE